MSAYQNILATAIIIIILFIMFPERSRKATKNLTFLIEAMPIGKLFQALIEYFKSKKAKD